VIDAHLLSHLSIIKDFYLGGRGEFLYTFLTTLSENLAKKTSMVDVRMRKENEVNEIQLRDLIPRLFHFYFLVSKRSVRLDVKECFHLAAMRVQVPEDVLQKIDIVVITGKFFKLITNRVFKYDFCNSGYILFDFQQRLSEF